MKYARVLLGHCPKETTQLFIDYYTGKYRPKKEIQTPTPSQPQAGSAVQNLAALLPLPYMNVGAGTKAPPSEAQLATEERTLESPPEYEIPKPRTAFSSFVDNPQEFITFLEALIKQNLKEEDKVDLYTTLFEMYLDTANRKKDTAEKQEWENKAKKLIEGKNVRAKVKPRAATGANFIGRFLYRLRTSCFSPTFPTSRKGQLLCGSKKAFGPTYFGHIPLQRTLKV